MPTARLSNSTKLYIEQVSTYSGGGRFCKVKLKFNKFEHSKEGVWQGQGSVRVGGVWGGAGAWALYRGGWAWGPTCGQTNRHEWEHYLHYSLAVGSNSDHSNSWHSRHSIQWCHFFIPSNGINTGKLKQEIVGSRPLMKRYQKSSWVFLWPGMLYKI